MSMSAVLLHVRGTVVNLICSADLPFVFESVDLLYCVFSDLRYVSEFVRAR